MRYGLLRYLLALELLFCTPRFAVSMIQGGLNVLNVPVYLVGDMASLLPHCGHFRIDVNSKYRWPADRQTPNRMAGGNG